MVHKSKKSVNRESSYIESDWLHYMEQNRKSKHMIFFTLTLKMTSHHFLYTDHENGFLKT